MDRQKSIGLPLYDNQRISLNPDLLIGLVQAMMLLGEELGEAKGPLREAELGEYQISILSKDHLAYVVIQDTYDSEPFTRRILQGVINKYHTRFKGFNLNVKIEDEKAIKTDIIELLKTMKFPMKKLETIEPLVKLFLEETHEVCDTFLLSDLDDGIITIWKQESSDNIIKILMEILSEIPFERQWVGESKLLKGRRVGDETRSHEAWFIHRIGETDYCLMGRAFYHPTKDRDILIDHLESLSNQILEIVSQ